MKDKRSINTYSEAVAFLESLGNVSEEHNRKKRLQNFENFLAFLGNPQKDFKAIHIAGTSGKGSVAVMFQNILLSAGKSVGLYTSPHTTTFCERIKVGKKYIGEKELVWLANFLKEKMDECINQKSKACPRVPSGVKSQKCRFQSLNFFEASFILALLYFQKTGCEYIVVEAGMGGWYDVTNIFIKPIYTIITNIGRDHLEKIGPTLADVAREKAGIIKRGAPILTGERDKRWIKIFKRQAKLLNCYIVKLLNYKNLKNVKTGLDGTSFEYKGEKYELKLLGEHQARNAALAIECAGDLKIPPAAVKKGLARAFYPARLEIISKKPLIIIDGAHNADKLRAGLEFLRSQKPKTCPPVPSGVKNMPSCPIGGQKYLILAMARNKEIKKIISDLSGYFDKIYLTRFSNPFRKCFGLADWKKMFGRPAYKKLIWRHHPKDALLDSLRLLHNNDVLLITGSIFLAGELREYWYKERHY